jgi:hypothetical protein
MRIGIFTAREQFVQAQAEVGELLARIREPVLCIDVRGGRLMPEDLADAGLGAMRNDNPLFLRCALLVTSPMLGLQLTRLSREANNVRRKIFDTPGQLALWLRPHLTDPEFVRLEAFLSERPSLSAMPVAGERPANPSGH